MQLTNMTRMTIKMMMTNTINKMMMATDANTLRIMLSTMSSTDDDADDYDGHLMWTMLTTMLIINL